MTKSNIRNVRIGMGEEPYKINAKDIPFLRKILQAFEDKA